MGGVEPDRMVAPLANFIYCMISVIQPVNVRPNHLSFTSFLVYFRDSVVVTLLCCGTSVFAGLAVFSVVGFMAHELNLPIKEVIRPGKTKMWLLVSS